VTQAVFWIIIVSPVVETLLFQWAVLGISLSVDRLRRRSWIGCVISALLFGWAHGGGLVLFTATFVVGLILAYGYLLAYPTNRRAFVVVAASHALHNAMAVLARTLA
jgi:membrane protease YdiL (CAAX protease family)